MVLVDLSSPVFLWVLAAAFGAGLIDAMVGGGGLIQLPALLSAFPKTSPAILLGTNKLASIFGTLSAVARFSRKVSIPWRMLMPLACLSFAGAVGGAVTVSFVPPDVFRPLVPVMLTAVLVYMIRRKDLGAQHTPSKMTANGSLLVAALCALIGFYDGFFGPGTGTFFMLIFVRIFGFDFLHSAACARVLNVGTNLAALAYFGLRGEVLLLAGGAMAICNVAGAICGAHLAVRHGSGFIRRIFIVVVMALIAKSAWVALRG